MYTCIHVPFYVSELHNYTCMQYYDWETNTCHRLDWLEDNEFSHVESDTEIPAEIDPSQTTYFPDFEPERLKTMVTLLH